MPSPNSTARSTNTANDPERALNRLCLAAIRIGCVAVLAAAAGWNIRFAVADILALRHQPQSLRQAMRLLPVNGAYAAQLADAIYITDPESAAMLLQQAVRLNPRDAASWIQLGLLQEADNHADAAEAALLRAADADATFLPAWSLTNFYFRRQNPSQFWRWAQKAAHVAPGDATALFRLAWYVNPSAPVIEQRLQLRQPSIQAQFVAFLMARNDPQAVQQAAVLLLQADPSGSRQALLGACEWLLAAHHPEIALPLWNLLAAQHQVPYPPLSPSHGAIITNGDFERQPLALGFDWHLPTIEGVSSFLNHRPNALGFEFSGDEPDHFTLLTQSAPVAADGPYALLVRYKSGSTAADSGFAWNITDDRTGTLLAKAAPLSFAQDGSSVVCFTVPANTRFIHLALEYQRQPGTVRPEGKLILAEIRLAAATGQPCGQHLAGTNTPDS